MRDKKYVISSQQELEQFKDAYGYYVDGSLEVNCSLSFTGRLYVKNNLSIKAGAYIKACGYIEAGWSIEAGGYIKAGAYIKACGYIEAGWSIEAGGSIKAGEYIKAGAYIEACGYIEAGWYIEAGGYIEAGEYIKAGWSIKAGEYIKAGGYIEAGEYIEAGGSIFSFTFLITCKYFSTKRLPFWREYYAEMKPFAKWKAEILDESKCWGDYKSMVTKEEAKQICEWEGWHPIIRAQLEMFFRLKDKHYIGAKQ